MTLKNEENFYNKVAKKFGGYGYAHKNYNMVSEYPNANPEQVFKEKLLELSGSNKKALDVGCGDCKFAYEIAPNFDEITGIDTSSELLSIANEKKKSLNIANVFFYEQNAEQTSFEDESFDIIFCRRGPTYFDEYFRLLKKGGYYLEIDIGEKDTMELKQVFGRGQNYGKWNNSQKEKDIKDLKEAGFKIIFAQDYKYNEYYKTINDLDLFLQGVPIFTDFDSVKDMKKLEEYCQKFTTPKGIDLPRHRVVIVAQK